MGTASVVRVLACLFILFVVDHRAPAAVTDIAAPVTVQASLESDVPAWDLCWSDHQSRAVTALAAELASQMTDPGRLYILSLPGLDGNWQRVRGKGHRDMVGAAIPKRGLKDGRRTYERDLEAALLSVIAEVRARRPGARMALAAPFTGALERAGDYVLIDQSGSVTTGKKGKKNRKNRKKRKHSRNQAEVPDATAGSWRVWSENGVWRLEASEEFPFDLLEPSVEMRDTWSGMHDVIIELPSRREAPFGSQHGPQTRATLNVLPAEYDRRSDMMVGIMLSFRGTADAERDTNPRGWRRRFSDLPEQGWDTLDPYMEQLKDLGVREVWFWGWAGQHPNRGGLSGEVMPWFGDEGHTDVMRESWPAFVSRWKGRGFTFGYWLGGIAIPNVGTILEPDHHYITRADFDYIADTLHEIRRSGFDAVGLDAFKWILAQRDRPEWANWRANHTGERDPGIAMALLERIRTDQRLRGMRVVTENRAPYGEILAAAPTLQLFSSTAAPRGSRPMVTTIEPTDIEDVVNPGHEIIMMLSTDGWTRQEYDLALERITANGYRPAVAFEVLIQVGLVKRAGDL